MSDFGMIKAAAAVPDVSIADPETNAVRIIERIRETDADVIVFPELSVTGYTCGELFRQSALLQASEQALGDIAAATAQTPGVLAAFGAPIPVGNRLYNCAVFCANGKLLGAVPKKNIPSYGEYYEGRWFSPSTALDTDTITICAQEIPIGTDLLFCDTTSSLVVGAELCEDLWAPVPPSSMLALQGADIIFNLSADSDAVGKYSYLRNLLSQQSARSICGYVYTSCGFGESTQDVVFSGKGLIFENGAQEKQFIDTV